MQFSSKSAGRAPLFVVLALAAMLLVPVSANAAMGGANPEVATLTPNLRSVTVTAVDTVNVTTTVQFCFDKPIGSLPDPNQLKLGTYREFERAADSASRVGTSCASAVYSSVPTDPIEKTYGHADDNAVTNAANGFNNLGDSSAVILPAGLGTNTGTANHSEAPTLIGCTVNNGTSTANFVFDKLLSGVATGTTSFQLERQSGTLIPSLGTSTNTTFSGNTASVKFAAGSTATGVRCVIQPFSAFALGEVPSSWGNRFVQAVARPGSSGNTDLPDFISSTLAADCSYVDFTFDETVNAPDFTKFHVEYADAFSPGSVNTPAAAADVSIVNGNTIRWKPAAGLSDRCEYLVQASVDRGAVTSTTTANTSSEGHNPLGDNAGAFAQGYSMGPEALRLTLDKTVGVANVLLDSRFTSSSNAAFRLVDDTGTVIPASPISISGAGGPPQQVTAKATFTPAQTSGAFNLQLLPGAVTTADGFSNVEQILGTTATAKLVRRHGRVQWKKASSRRALMRHARNAGHKRSK